MAVVKIYIGPDGNDANNGTTRALRIQGRTRLLALVAALGAGDTARIMAEGVFTRNTTGWATSNHWFDLDGTATPKLEGFRLSATNVEDAAAPLPEWCNYDWIADAWTDTGTTTTRGTKIWSHTIIGSVVARVWAADSRSDATYWKKELWEGGANYSSDFTEIHKNLDWIPGLNTYGCCWTHYNAAGTVQATTMYMACPTNPYTMFGAISYLTNGMTEVMRIINLSNWTVDPEVTVRGCGLKSIVMDTVGAAGPCEMHAAIYGASQLGVGYGVFGVAQNVTIGPVYEPLYPHEVPFYNGLGHDGGVHSVGGNHGVHIDSTADLSAADGYWDTPGKTTFGVRIKATSTRGNGTTRVNFIRDAFHAGVGNLGPGGAIYHQYISIDDGMQFDFRNVLYGRAFNFSGTANARYIRIGAILSHNTPSPSQLTTYNSSFIGGRTHGKNSIGAGYITPHGTASASKENFDCGFAAFTGTGGQNFSDIDVHHNEFMCAAGGVIPSVTGGVAFAGPLRMADNVTIRPWFQRPSGYDPTFYQAMQYVLQTSADAVNVQLRNNVMVGYAATCVRTAVISPSSGGNSTPEASLPAATNSGWTAFADFESYMQAKRVGQIRV